MSLLDHPLIKKYFGVEHPGACGCPHDDCQDNYQLSYSVLTAMQQPIHSGDKFLWRSDIEGWKEFTATYQEGCIDGFHPMMLRLPDRHQPDNIRFQPSLQPKQECTHGHQHAWDGCECMDYSKCCCSCHHAKQATPEQLKNIWLGKPDPVEDKITVLRAMYECGGNKPCGPWQDFEVNLRELVCLARESK